MILRPLTGTLVQDDRMGCTCVRAAYQIGFLNEEVLILALMADIDTVVIRMMKQVQRLVLALSLPLLMMMMKALGSREMTLRAICHAIAGTDGSHDHETTGRTLRADTGWCSESIDFTHHEVRAGKFVAGMRLA